MKPITRMTAIAVSVALLGALTAATPAFAADLSGGQVVQQSRCPLQLPVNCPTRGPNFRHGWRVPTQPVRPVQPTQPAKPSKPAQPGSGANMSAAEQQILGLVNGERTKAGLAPLQGDAQLTQVARLKSQDMVTNNYFDHQSPTYGSPFDMLAKFGITYQTAGENIAGNPSVEGAFQAWMNSPGHRANIMNPAYTKTGIGIVSGGQYGMIFTEEFTG